jgi:ribonuclease HI
MSSHYLGRSRTIQEARSSTSNIQDTITSDSFLNRIIRRGSGCTSSQQIVQLEEEIDLNRNINLYNQHQLDILNPRILYQTGVLNVNTTLIRSTREESLRVVDKMVTIDLFSPETIERIKQSKKNFVHTGLIVIGIKALGRKNLGTKLLALLLDKSWKTELKKAIISGMEIDLSQNTALFYCTPGILKDIRDLQKIKIALQTKGYENYEGNNIVISIGVLGKASNRSGMKYKVNIEGIVNTIASKSIQMIDPIKIDPEELAGLEWQLDDLKEEENIRLVPKKSYIYEGASGIQSLRFTDFKKEEKENEDSEEAEYTFMNIEINEEKDYIEPIYDTENEEINTEFYKFEEEETDYSLLEYFEEEETNTGFKIEETNKTIEQIINRKFTEMNIQEEVDDMIIECMLNLGMTYEESYNKLQEYYNLPLVDNIIQGKTMISDFYKQEQSFMDQDMKGQFKRGRIEWSSPGTSAENIMGREPWTKPTTTYQQESNIIGKGNRLPIGNIYSGNMLLLEQQKPQLWNDEILTWEQTVVRMWETNKKESMDMFSYLETTLGPIALGIWQSKKAQDPTEMNRIKALGDNPYNFTSQIRTLILGVDPAKNNSLIQDTAIRNLEQLSIADMKYINEFTVDFTRLLSQTGLAMDDDLCNKYFIKLPGDLGKNIHELWKQQYGEQRNLGIGPRITFTFGILEERCKEVALQEQLKRNAYAFCKTAIYTPQAYGYYDKKKKLRRSTTYNKEYKPYYKNRPHYKNRYVKKPQTRQCKCYICGDEKHLANRCPDKNKNTERSNLVEQLNDYEIEAVDTDHTDNESIYSIYSEDEQSITKVTYTYMNTEEDCKHKWISKRGNNYIKCYNCGYYPSIEKRSQCNICFQEICYICLKKIYDEEMNIEEIINKPEINGQREKIKNLEMITELHSLKIENIQNKIIELEELCKKKKEKEVEYEVSKMSTEAEQTYIQTQGSINMINIQCRLWLDNNKALDLPALVDTGATKSLISYSLAPQQYHKKFTYNLVTRTAENRLISITHYLEPVGIQFLDFAGNYSIKYEIPQVNINPQHIKSKDFVLGLNFLFGLNGAITLTRHFITLSKHVYNFPTLRYNSTSEFAQKRGGKGNLDFLKNKKEQHIENETIKLLTEFMSHELEKGKDVTKSINYPTILHLEKIGLIGEDIRNSKVKHTCKFKIKNPDITIRTTNIEYSPLDKEEFKKQIPEMLEQGLIRKSESPHRSSAFIVKNHSEIKRGKARIVYNYKRLNDNTEDDGYNIPNKDSLLNLIQRKKVFSKFDLKSGYNQLQLEEDFKPWTAFTCSEGQFEWNVLSFGLKNAPSIFQRFMDSIFLQYNFCLVYIDDILVASETVQEHEKHLQQVFEEIKKNGIVVSKRKMELFKRKISFLGLEIGNGKIELQPHISTKILEFPEKIQTLKQIQAFLGLVNYARKFIPNLSKLVGPLYSKTTKNGQRHFNQEDIKLIKEIKMAVKNIKPLELPLVTDYIIIEVDGCKEGWGAVLLSKPNKYSSKDDEKICSYASGNFKTSTNWTSLDFEIQALLNALEKFKIFLHSEFTVRTDCEAIVKFIKNDQSKKMNRTRWVNLQNVIQGSGYTINFEHIKGKNNGIADMLSRNINKLLFSDGQKK